MTELAGSGGVRWLGPVDEAGEPLGRGTMTFADGTVYTGSVNGPEQRGTGRWSYPDGSRMEGGFTLCRENPLFRFTFPDGRQLIHSLLFFCGDAGREAPDAVRACLLIKNRLSARGQEIEFNARALLADAMLRGMAAPETPEALPADRALLRLPDAVYVLAPALSGGDGTDPIKRKDV